MKYTYSSQVSLKASIVHAMLAEEGIVFNGVSIDGLNVTVLFDHSPNTSEHEQIQSLIEDAASQMVREEAIKSVSEFATATRLAVAGNPDYLEAMSWTSKELRALRYSSGTANPTDLGILQAEVDSRGFNETVDDLVSVQLAKAAALATAAAQIDGIVAKAHADLKAVPVEDIPNYLEQLSLTATAMVEAFTGA